MALEWFHMTISYNPVLRMEIVGQYSPMGGSTIDMEMIDSQDANAYCQSGGMLIVDPLHVNRQLPPPPRINNRQWPLNCRSLMIPLTIDTKTSLTKLSRFRNVKFLMRLYLDSAAPCWYVNVFNKAGLTQVQQSIEVFRNSSWAHQIAYFA